MSLGRLVSRHSKLIVALWIILIVLSWYLAKDIDKYVTYTERKWLPENAESVKAEDILSRSSLDPLMLLVSGFRGNYCLLEELVNKTVMSKCRDCRVEGPCSLEKRLVRMLYTPVEKIADVCYNLSKIQVLMLAGLDGLAEGLNATYHGVFEALKMLNDRYWMVYNALTQIDKGLLEAKEGVEKLRETCNTMVDTVYHVEKIRLRYCSIYRSLVEDVQANVSRELGIARLLHDEVSKASSVALVTMFNLIRGDYYAHELGVCKGGEEKLHALMVYTNVTPVGPVPPQLIDVVCSVSRVQGVKRLAKLVELVSPTVSKPTACILEGFVEALNVSRLDPYALLAPPSAGLENVKKSQEVLWKLLVKLVPAATKASTPCLIGYAASLGSSMPSVIVYAALTGNYTLVKIYMVKTLAEKLSEEFNIEVKTSFILAKALVDANRTLADIAAALTLAEKGVDKKLAFAALYIVEELDPLCKQAPPENLVREQISSMLAEKMGIDYRLVRAACGLENVESVLIDLVAEKAPQPQMARELAIRVLEAGGPGLNESMLKKLARQTVLEYAKSFGAPYELVEKLIDIVSEKKLEESEVYEVAWDVAKEEFVKQAQKHGFNISLEVLEYLKPYVERGYLDRSGLMKLLEAMGVPEDKAEELAKVLGGLPFVEGWKEKVADYIYKEITSNETVAKLFVVIDVMASLGDRAKDVVHSFCLAGALNMSKPLYKLEFYRASLDEPIRENLVSMGMVKDGSILIIVDTPDYMSNSDVYNLGKHVVDMLRKKGLEAYMGGLEVQRYEMSGVFKEEIRRIDKIAFAIVAIVLILVMGSLAASILPIASIASATLLGSAMVVLLAREGLVTITTWARALMFTTALGLGVDYSAYLVARLREELGKGLEPREAVAKAVDAVLPGILASAVTDALGFASFALAWELPFLQSIGTTIPFVVVAVALASVTLVPALLVHVSRFRSFWWPRRPKPLKPRAPLLARASVYAPKAILLLIALLAIPAAYIYVTYQGSYDIKLFMVSGTESLRFAEALEKHLGAGRYAPTYIVVAMPDNVTIEWLERLDKLASTIKSLEFVENVYTVTRPYGKPILGYGLEPRDILNISRKYVIESSPRYAVIEVILKVNPLSAEGLSAVRKLHDIVHREADKLGIKEVLVGGYAALIGEVDDFVSKLFWRRVLPAAAIFMFISMVLTFRAVAAGIVSLLTVALGVSFAVAFSQWFFQTFYSARLLWFLPTIAAVAALGVGMDYNSFYINRAIEECRGRSGKEAAIITSAAVTLLVLGLSLIAAGSYMAMTTSRVIGLKEIGFTLAASIVFTALLAASLLWPALVAALGPKLWWPRRVERSVEHGAEGS